MGYKALYRTYRPTSFEEVVGQKHIITTLMNAVKQNKTAHAYLLCGPRGTGKTSVARLLAKAVNCEDKENAPCNVCENCKASDAGTHQDIVEIDAASSSGVDQIRDLIEKVKYSPIQGKFKVYIIDEVHMLSQGAFNALLKTLEEPPAHVIFVLATTEPYKVLPTIISRCQRYDFGKVAQDEIIQRLRYVVDTEGIKVDDEALRLVAVLSDGGMRDALSILDQCIAYAQDEITVKHVNDIYGITTIKEKMELIQNIFDKDARSLLNMIQSLNEKGVDIRRLTNDLVEVLKESVIYSYTSDSGLLQILNVEEVETISNNKDANTLLKMIDVLMEATVSYRNASNVTSYFEVAVLKMIGATTEKAQVVEVVKPIVSLEPKRENMAKPEVKIEKEVVDNIEVSDEEIQEEVKPKKQESIPTLDSEFVLSLLSGASKENKELDKQIWNTLDSKSREMTCAKCATILKHTEIAASGQDYLVLATDSTAEANQINDLQLNQELYYFVKEQCDLDKMIYAIDKNLFARITQEFKERWTKNELPDAAIITKYKKVVTKEKKKTSEEKLIDLFGEENITIFEEE
ncbi:DNA polymerase III subunit gamma/tau [Anaerorhabdus furcosa]|uniref:DNA-directed DNA polymerase n=1 Tax=Anaerorhabdus furcosa TaxID=118967 RepID=A0A1T4MUU8_9FIRM|nr:DNA polymerase III subunit gamma/tau [Anaerorhabdus furcosa]SJZ70880.1 DNA polymerase-3 subunit gamma/tau [Anaerorhabdus furcosa]